MAGSSALEYWIGFNLVRGIGSARLRALLDAFGDLETAWRAPADQLKAAGLDRRSLENLLDRRSKLDLPAEVAKLERLAVTALTWDDAAYPRRLREIPNPPPLLYVRGSLTEADEWTVAIVGTRRASAYGREAAREFASRIASSGATVVSGLARGIDAVAHQAAVQAGGRTIAVLGSGVDAIYPPEHRGLAGAIIRSGALVSEMPLGSPPESGNFPARNRIISGLSLATLVVEAGETSGALLTAEFAVEQGREVFAVPGSIFSACSQGTNRLIRDGARPALAADDVLEALDLTQVAAQVETRAALPVDETESKLLKYLSAIPIHVDELGHLSELPIAQVSSTLAIMELKGLVRQVGGMQYVAAGAWK